MAPGFLRFVRGNDERALRRTGKQGMDSTKGREDGFGGTGRLGA